MPMWRVYHPDTVYTDPAEKKAFADAVAAIYTRLGFPAFWSNVLFIPLPEGNICVGGRPNIGPDCKPFIRISYGHALQKDRSPEVSKAFLDMVNKAMKPFIMDKGYEWEISGYEGPRHFWRTEGIDPPEQGTEIFKQWVKENRAIPYY